MNSRGKEIFHYILPSAGGLCVTYLYNIVDGIFVGRGVGALALAAVNITVPFITTLVAISTLFAMGGSTVIAIRLGRGDKKGANDAFMTALVLTFLLSVLLLIVGMALPGQIALLCGSSEAVLPLAREYLFYYTAFAIPFLLSNCLAIFVRNDGAPGLAFWGMCAGAAANIWSGSFICDLDQSFYKEKGRTQNKEILAVFGTDEKDLQPGSAGTLGDMGVATFSVLSFIYSLANAILSGVAQGMQPLWGHAFGKKDETELRTDFRAGMKINLAASVVIYVILAVFRVPVVTLFNNEPELVAMASKALPVFAVSFVFMAVNLIFTAYYYSTKQTWKSNIIAVSRGIVIKAAAIFLVPVVFGTSWVWASAAVAEGVTLIIIGIIYLGREENKKDYIDIVSE